MNTPNVSIFMDLAQRRVVFATEGRDADTVGAFADDLAAHGGSPKTQVATVCCDMSPASMKGIGDHLAEHPRPTRMPRRTRQPRAMRCPRARGVV